MQIVVGTNFPVSDSITDNDVHDLTEKRLYLRLYFSHFQPVTKVNTLENVFIEGYVEEFDPTQ